MILSAKAAELSDDSGNQGVYLSVKTWELFYCFGGIVILQSIVWILLFCLFTSLVSFTGVYTEDEPNQANHANFQEAKSKKKKKEKSRPNQMEEDGAAATSSENLEASEEQSPRNTTVVIGDSIIRGLYGET